MNRRDLITPVRTRGPIRTRGAQQENVTAPQAIRTRGAIRTSGTAPTPVAEATTLKSFLNQLREEVGGMPLTILVHGWGSTPSDAFYQALAPLLNEQDALWLIPSHASAAPDTINGPGGAVVLDLDQDTPRRTYNNLAGDVVFFPALEEEEAEQAAQWKRRAGALIVHSEGPQRETVLQASLNTDSFTYLWFGGDELKEIAP